MCIRDSYQFVAVNVVHHRSALAHMDDDLLAKWLRPRPPNRTWMPASPARACAWREPWLRCGL
eukprot:4242464-Prymnesium_polylepis.3